MSEGMTLRRRVLVMDDDADTVDSLALLLELCGCEVRTARDGGDGVATAAAFEPDLVLIDPGMSRAGGWDAVRRIREQPNGREIRIVAHSGWTRDSDRERSTAAGCDAHLFKPVEVGVLLSLLNK